MSHYKQGMEHFNSGELSKAAECFVAAHKLADDDAPAALYALAICCELSGLTEEYEAAITRSAALGYPAAQGECLLEGIMCNPNVSQGLRLLLASAESGDTVAQGSLGMHYINGIHIEPDQRIARFWVAMAASHGNRLMAEVLASIEQGDS